jgi:3-hydroxyacyl-CoA dehydrogenase
MQNEVLVRNVVVVGAGTMGSGIAAHLANLGFGVSLLDSTQERVTEAFEHARSARPPHFFTPERANEIRLGNVIEHREWIREADWVIEAIVERLDAKQRLYADLEPLLRPDAMITTNTSGLPIASLAQGRSESFRRRFMGTHFFNPPRYLKLLELIPTTETDDALVGAMTQFLENRVARRVVVAKDTPGFIANRFGMWCMFHAVHVAEKLQLQPEEVDLITGPFLGRPKSASFRLCDIVGIDVMRDISSSLRERLPNDPRTNVLQDPRSVAFLAARKWLGDKVGQGFYRRQGKESLVFDLITHAYREPREAADPSLVPLREHPLGERVARALELKDPAGDFLRTYLLPALEYADELKAEVSHSVLDFDRVMQWGFGWEMGPFALADAIGRSQPSHYLRETVRNFEGTYEVVSKNPEYLALEDGAVIGRGQTFHLRDLGDGVTAVCLDTKMGMITPALVDELTQLLRQAELGRFVLTSTGRAFSVGFDLKFFLSAIADARWNDIEDALTRLQKLGEMLERRNVVAAIHGYGLGAGLELALSCSTIVAHPEANIGLPEAKVGLLPGGRGTTLVRLYNQHNAKRLTEVALNLAQGLVAPNADAARAAGYLRPTDITCYHPDRLLFEAKQAALTAKPVSRPAWTAPQGPLSGMIDRELEVAEKRGEITEYDGVIGDKIKGIFARSTSYEDALKRERTEFRDLSDNALTLTRIRHMVDTSRPLRN